MSDIIEVKLLAKNPWKGLSPYSPFVEQVPVDLLLDFANPSRSPYTDMGYDSVRHRLRPTLYAEDVVWRNVMAEGMFDPMIFRVDVERGVGRLEAGNHRIHQAQGVVTHLPTVCIVCARDRVVDHEGNGTHSMPLDGRFDVEAIRPLGYDYPIRPSEVFDTGGVHII